MSTSPLFRLTNEIVVKVYEVSKVKIALSGRRTVTPLDKRIATVIFYPSFEDLSERPPLHFQEGTPGYKRVQDMIDLHGNHFEVE